MKLATYEVIQPLAKRRTLFVQTWYAWMMGTRTLATLLLAAAACSTSISSRDPDAAVSTVDVDESPGLITIRIRNDGARMLYVGGGQEVITVLKPGGVAVGRDSCEICNCATCPSCAVCGRALARVAEIAPGATLDFKWDQLDWSVVENGCRPTLACERVALVPPGPLTARAHYSDTYTTTTFYGPQESVIGPVLTAETVFEHPASDVVVVPIL